MCQEDKNTSLEEMFATIDNIYATNPEIVPVTNVQSSEIITSTSQQVETTDTSFNLTKPIQQTINTFKPTKVLTEYQEVFFLPGDTNCLKPVPDHTITQLLILFAGRGTRPYMLDGTLLAHTSDGAYLKIIPYINASEDERKRGYASYKFVVINYKILNFIIDKYIKLLTSTGKYDGLLDYDDAPTKKSVFAETDVEMVFGNKAIPKPMPKAKNTIDKDGFIDRDAETLYILKDMLKARKQSTYKHLESRVLSEKIASQSQLYDEDKELLGYLQSVVNRVYKELEKPYKSPYIPYIDALYISGHHLSKWVYDPVEYTNKITNGNGKWSIDHILQGVEHRSNNSPDNLSIELAKYNGGRTSRSIPVEYQGTPYVSIASYCTTTSAGNPATIAGIKASLNAGEFKDYNDRVYTLSADGKKLVATDIAVKASQLTYNGVDYATPKAFAAALKLSYNSLNNALVNARKAGKSEFECKLSYKKFRFYLDENGKITKII